MDISALIGIKVNPEIFNQGTRTIKAFEHNFPETVKFHPQTNEPLWKEEIIRHPAYCEGKHVQLPTFGGFDIIGDEANNYSDGEVWLVIDNASTETDIKEKMRKLLEPIGAWNDAAFVVLGIVAQS